MDIVIQSGVVAWVIMNVIHESLDNTNPHTTSMPTTPTRISTNTTNDLILLSLLRHDLLVLLALLLENVAGGGELGEVVAVQLAAALPIAPQPSPYLTKTALKELERVGRVPDLQHSLSQLVRELLVVRDSVQGNHVYSLLRVADERYH